MTGENFAIKAIEWGDEEFAKKQFQRELNALRKVSSNPPIDFA